MQGLHSENMPMAALWPHLMPPDTLNAWTQQPPCPLPGTWSFWEPCFTRCRGLKHHLNQSFRRRGKKKRQPSLTEFVERESGHSKFCDCITAFKSRLTKQFSFVAWSVLRDSRGRPFCSALNPGVYSVMSFNTLTADVSFSEVLVFTILVINY